MKSLMPASIKPVTSWRQQVQMVWHVSIMCSLAHVPLFYKATRTKSVRSSSTRRVTRLSRHPATRHADCGTQRLAMRFSAWEPTLARVTRTKFSVAPSTTKVTLSLRAQKIIPAVFGRTTASSNAWSGNKQKFENTT